MTPEATKGAKLLRQYLDAQGLSIPAFADRHDFCRIQIQRAIKGERKKISVDFALAIQRATGGAVPMAAWAHEQEATELAAAVA